MINKVIIHSRDVVKEYEVSRVHIFTDKYNKKVSEKDLHCPKTAKLVIEFDHLVTAFYLPSPILQSATPKTLDVFVDEEFDKITRKVPFIDDFKTYKEDLRLFRLLTVKRKIGLSLDEIFLYNKLEILLQLKKLIEKTEVLEKGGGF